MHAKIILAVHNFFGRSRKPQVVEPVVTGHFFIGEAKLHLPERSTIEYMITYHPTEATKLKKHTVRKEFH